MAEGKKPNTRKPGKTAAAPQPSRTSAQTKASSRMQPSSSADTSSARGKAAPAQGGQSSSRAAATEAEGRRNGASQSDRPSVQRKKTRWPFYVIGAVLAVALVIVGLFSWDRWYRYDDEQDIQGQWVVLETQQPVTIAHNEIAISDQVGYPYALDTWNKTIEYHFGGLSGSGRYRFSENRQTLVIVEGEEGDMFADVVSVIDQLVNGTDLRTTDSEHPTTILVKASA